jgi:hypothetical protein
MVLHMDVSFDLPRNESAGLRDRRSEIIERMGVLGWEGASYKHVGAGFGLSFHLVAPADLGLDERSNGDRLTVAHNCLGAVKTAISAMGLIPMEIEISMVVDGADGRRNLGVFDRG